MKPDSAIIIGASSGLGRALAYTLAEKGHSLIIAARDIRDLEALASDISLRSNVEAVPVAIDLGNPEFNAEAFAKNALEKLPSLSKVFITAGLASDDDTHTATSDLTESLVRVNFITPSKLVQAFANLFKGANKGSITAISSIAAGAPRSRNIAYAAAKRALESYCFSIQHAFSDTDIKIQICRLGYVDSAMTFGKKLLFPVLSPEKASRIILDKLSTDARLYYCPWYWRYITLLLTLLPWPVYKKLKF